MSEIPTSSIGEESVFSKSSFEEESDTIGSHDIIHLNRGDPTMYEDFWKNMANKCTVTISSSQLMSYFTSNKTSCWFLDPKLEEEIRQLHRLVGNAVVEGYHIVVGTGSVQLIHAALFALSPSDGYKPISVVCATPYYSYYPEMTDFLRSRLYKWAGDACIFDNKEPYIELVTSPNNPDGTIREPIVKGGQGKLVHDLAYYWPQYSPVTFCADYDIMLFTISKCTGHAGSRIGWALIKDENIATRMTKFIEISTIGVSKESQLRAAKILEFISNNCLHPSPSNFFEHSLHLMAQRWERLVQVVRASNQIFTLPEYPQGHCLFTKELRKSHPAFAWMKCNMNDIEDFEEFLKEHKIVTRGGKHFGSNPCYARINMIGGEAEFNLFLERLLSLQKPV